MKEKYLIKNLRTQEVFVGLGDLKPYFCLIEDCPPRLFDSHEQAINRIKEEYELFPQIFEGKILEIVRVYEF